MAATPPAPLRQRLEAWLTRQWQQPHPTAAARCLQPLAWAYGLLARRQARAQQRQARRAPRPLIVVGNLVAGGAGKTPTVMALVAQLQAMGHRPGVISRGHGRHGSGVVVADAHSNATTLGDEPLLIHHRCQVPVAVGRDRWAAAQALCTAHPALTVLVSDDGLQHHRLTRDAQILVFDDRGLGNGLLLPAGPLREPAPANLPAHTLVLYTGGRASTALPGYVGHRRLSGVLPLDRWWQGLGAGAHAGSSQASGGFAALQGRPVLAVAALARPEPFFAMLRTQGLLIDTLPLPDHAPLNPLPWPAGTPDVVVTEKDAVKLRPGHTGTARVWVAALDFRPEPAFDEALRSLCAPWTPARAPAP